LSDESRTAEQLRAEIVALKRQLKKRGRAVGKQSVSVQSPRGPVTRRSAFSLGLAPVMLLGPAVKAAKRWAKALKRRAAT
jgi:hypothetical protein